MVQGWRKEEGSGWGTHVYLWRIHFNIWQNQYNIVKFKNKIKFKKRKRAIHSHKENGYGGVRYIEEDSNEANDQNINTKER